MALRYPRAGPLAPVARQALPQFCRFGLVAIGAERSVSVQTAFAPTLYDRHDMVGLPQMTAAARTLPSLPLHCVDATRSTDALVPFEDLLPNVIGVGPDLPLMDAIHTAKRYTAGWDLLLTTSAQTPSVRTYRQRLWIDPAGSP